MALYWRRIRRHGVAHVQTVVRVHVVGGGASARRATAHAGLVKLKAVRAEVARFAVPVRGHDCD